MTSPENQSPSPASTDAGHQKEHHAHPRRQRQHHRLHDQIHRAQARAAAGTEIVGLTPRFGADSCEGNFEIYLAAMAVRDKVLSYPEPFDAVIQAGYGEHGREGLQELLQVPVVDITEAAASTAMFLGHKYSVVTQAGAALRLGYCHELAPTQ